jgi:hypothetical protein
MPNLKNPAKTPSIFLPGADKETEEIPLVQA